MQQGTGQQDTEEQQQPIIRVALEAVLPDGSSSRFDVQQVLQRVMKQHMPLVTLQLQYGDLVCHVAAGGDCLRLTS